MTMTPHTTSLPRRLLAAATLAAGFGTVWAVLVLWLGTAILRAWPGEARPRRESLVVTTDGTPLIQSVPLDNLSLMTYRGLDGREHDPVDRRDEVSPMTLWGEHRTAALFGSRPDWDQRIKVFMDEREPTAVWYFVHDGRSRGSGEFVGYERTSNRLIGYIGLSGFRAQPVPPGERIPVRGDRTLGYGPWSSVPLWINSGIRAWAPRPDRRDVPPRLVHVPSGNLLRLVDLAARTVTTVFEAPAPIASVGVPTVSAYSGGQSPKERPILVRAGPTIYKLDHQYKTIGTFSIPPQVGRRGQVTWYEADGGRAIVQCDRPAAAGEAPGGDVARSTVYVIGEDGAIRGSTDLALRTGTSPRQGRAEAALMALGLPAPAALFAAGSLMAVEGADVDVATALGAWLRVFWPSLAAALAIATVLAAVAWGRGRAFGLPGASGPPGRPSSSCSACPPTPASCSIVAGRSGSLARIATRPPPAIAAPAPSAEGASRTRPPRGSRSSPDATPAARSRPPGTSAFAGDDHGPGAREEGAA